MEIMGIRGQASPSYERFMLIWLWVLPNKAATQDPKMLVIRHLRRKGWLQQQSCAEPGIPSSPRKLGCHLQAQRAGPVTRSGFQQTQGQGLLLAGCACFPQFALPPNPFSALLSHALCLGRLVPKNCITWAALPSTSYCGQTMGNMQEPGSGCFFSAPPCAGNVEMTVAVPSVTRALPSLPSPQAQGCWGSLLFLTSGSWVL